MEDTVDAQTKFYEDLDFYAVFDGHGGDAVSNYLKANFRNILIKYLRETNKDVPAALLRTFNHIAGVLENENYSFHTGSTALVMVKGPKKIWIANIGDCRAVLKYFDGKSYKSEQLTTDHKPNNPAETKRIHELNGQVLRDNWGTWRVGGNLAVSRSFGDRYLHPWVTWQPEITSFDINDSMRAVIMASDGVWDTLTNNDVVNIAESVIRSNLMYDQMKIMNEITHETAIQAQKKGSGDNITVCFVIV